MKKTKLLKSILVPTLGISAIGIIPVVSTSCDEVHDVTSVSLNKTSITLAVGDTKTLTATILPENATDKSVTWSSNNESVAIVNENGTITAIGVGNATITVTTNDGGLTATCEVTVDTIHVTGVTLDKTSTTLAVGDTKTLTATILPENATDKSVTWSSNNESVAIVNENGTITAIGVGNATITVTTNDGGLTATCEVTVDTIHVTGVTLDKTSTTLAVGDTKTLTATILPENATDKSVTWSSNNESVAIVNENGTITAIGVGNATITVTTNDGGLTATCEVNVCNPYVVVTANADSTLELNNKGKNNPDLQYSTDDGASWITYSEEINIGQGQTLYLKGSNPNGWSTSSSSYSCLSFTGNVSISGNIMGLLDNGAAPGKEGDITTIPCDYCFYDLFENSTGITSISEDFLPATTLTNYCYFWMFDSCSSLTVAPELPATILKSNCYDGMFYRCTSLVTAPELPATTLTSHCYGNMFYECSSLNSIKISYIGNYDSTYFNSWVTGVASSGTFYYNGTTQTAQDFKLPSGWRKASF